MLGAVHDPFGYQHPPPSQRPPANPSPDSPSYATKTEAPAEDITSRARALLAPGCDNDQQRIGMERALATMQAYQGSRAPRPAAAGAYQSRFPRQASAPQGAGFNHQGRPRLRVPVCRACNKVGHLYRDCPDKDKQDGARQHLPHAPKGEARHARTLTARSKLWHEIGPKQCSLCSPLAPVERHREFVGFEGRV